MRPNYLDRVRFENYLRSVVFYDYGERKYSMAIIKSHEPLLSGDLSKSDRQWSKALELRNKIRNTLTYFSGVYRPNKPDNHCTYEIDNELFLTRFFFFLVIAGRYLPIFFTHFSLSWHHSPGSINLYIVHLFKYSLHNSNRYSQRLKSFRNIHKVSVLFVLLS